MSLSWDEVEGVPLLRWSGVAGVVAAFSGRRGGVSEGAYASLNLGLKSGDDLGRVAENRRRLCAAAAVDPARTSSCHQFHSAVVQVAEADPGRPFDDTTVISPKGDGLVTRLPGRGVVAFGSDCVPVVVARADGTGIGVCHAGWRGLLGGVVEHTVEQLGGGELRAGGRPVRRARRLRGRRRRGRAAAASASARPRCAARTPTSRRAPRSRWSAPASARSTSPASAPCPTRTASSRTAATAPPAAVRP